MLVALTGQWWLLAVGGLAVLAAWFYTGGASPYGYRGLGEVSVFVDQKQLGRIKDFLAEHGYLEGQHMADMFSMMRENDLIWSFVEANYLRGNKPRAFDLLYWNSDSTRLPAAMLLWKAWAPWWPKLSTPTISSSTMRGTERKERTVSDSSRRSR